MKEVRTGSTRFMWKTRKTSVTVTGCLVVGGVGGAGIDDFTGPIGMAVHCSRLSTGSCEWRGLPASAVSGVEYSYRWRWSRSESGAEADSVLRYEYD